MENTFVSKIRKDMKKKVEKRTKDSNVIGNLVKSGLETSVQKQSKEVIGKNLKINLAEVMKNKATETSYEIVKKKITGNIKQELAKYADQKSKDVFDLTTKDKKKKMKKMADRL
ncbi:MAG: hypothetical protein GW779_00045 [Candidatus Altiarchaeum hamiconexum]|uniref:Uncharacterized protein n=1 Tax=Candidatus Altarchaeum hamiconexum TaxID=1803513 RepID=A0A8J7YVY1_9ARCH|nr:hypothetical protein [Candidatus Altarchaeum hamiconexum]OIQ04646.1 MAG: hypothetical protein AUK59_06995 [Candidatus Altarchaeum sp. CG2_30_32_3053]PIN67182.1 MAG: hypothetical protein COV98_04345 [Candidatus Altarchaeum sp. CG12_big_fil_rev_8_21_14_0_65_33_22]PIV28233.1 MAG: hypothetical protein COS36_02980 [Candidatus Altarchaeum sp. CG03_land_8_20_14_0_80_32_618]PIX48669.1 MAG: hypothetical protein COZ53_03420 [Candidatus Altarchaeum sp. CG_4_8_14_3_um_filter_33_2054]PIZ30816.1 MAG: hyp